MLGQQSVKADTPYRMMRYVIRDDYDNHVLLQNVITGQLVVLDEAEAALMDQLPMAATPVMEELIKAYYLVPEGYDEAKKVIGLR